MFNPYERLDIGQDPRNSPDELRNYDGPGYPGDFRTIDQLGVPGSDQLSDRTVREIQVRNMEEQTLLRQQMEAAAWAPTAAQPPLPAEILPTPSYAVEAQPRTSEVSETSQEAEPELGTSQPYISEPAPYVRTVSPQERHFELRDKRRALMVILGAAVTAAGLWAGSAIFGSDSDDELRPAQGDASPGGNLSCVINGVGESSSTTGFVDLTRADGRPLGDRVVGIIGEDSGGSRIGIRALPADNSPTSYEFRSRDFHGRTISVLVANGDQQVSCGQVTLGEHGSGDEQILPGR